MDFQSRIEKTQNEVNKCLFSLMETKKSNLCLAVDLHRTEETLECADKFGPHIVVLKLHVAIIEDFNYLEFTEKLDVLKKKHRFLVFEDAKFGDIGNTNLQLYVGGIFRIQNWADLITSHVITGPESIEALKKGVNSSEPRACLLVAQMSNKGNTLDGVEVSRSIAQKYPSFVAGFISQSTIINDPGYIQFTPGVNIGVDGDSLGQQYISPEEAVLNRGADIIIVGRGILKSPDPLKRLLEFKERGYKNYLEKVARSNAK